MRISDWSSDVCSSDLQVSPVSLRMQGEQTASALWLSNTGKSALHAQVRIFHWTQAGGNDKLTPTTDLVASPPMVSIEPSKRQLVRIIRVNDRSEEHTSELQSLMRISYAVFCLKKKK